MSNLQVSKKIIIRKVFILSIISLFSASAFAQVFNFHSELEIRARIDSLTKDGWHLEGPLSKKSGALWSQI